MFHSSFWQRLAFVVSCVLLVTMSLTGALAPQAAFAQPAAGSRTATVTPNQGPPSTQVMGSGTNWTAGDAIHTTWDDGSQIAPNVQVDSNGTFTNSPKIPANATQGGHTIYFTDSADHFTYPVSFTVTSTPAVTVDKTFTRDGNGNAKSAFVPGDAIQYAEILTNHTSSSVTATFNVQATNPNGSVIFSSQWNMTLPSGTVGVYTPSTVPTNATAGTYTFKVTVTCNGGSSSGQSQFTVATVVVQQVWTGDSNNNAKTSFAPGDAIHYLVQVKNFTSTTVTATFTFLATGPQQIFSLTASAPVAPGTKGFYSPSTVPSNAPAGRYTFMITVTYNGVSSQGKSLFTVLLVKKWNIWAGYASVASTSNPVTSYKIGGQWTVPSVSCTSGEKSSSAAWIGLGGLMPGGTQTGHYIAQIGTISQCKSGSPDYWAVYEMYNAYNPLESLTYLFHVAPDDAVTATVTYTGNGNYQLSISSPNKWSWSNPEAGSSSDEARYSAEWIVEQTGGYSSLSHFSTVKFFGCYANNNQPINGGPITEQLIMQPSNSTPKAVPSPLDSQNKTFTVTWQHP